jgi:hypothetical protein
MTGQQISEDLNGATACCEFSIGNVVLYTLRVAGHEPAALFHEGDIQQSLRDLVAAPVCHLVV